VLQRVEEERNILQTAKRRETNRICNILRRNYLLKYVTEGKKEEKKVIGRRGRRRKQLTEDLREKRKYCKQKAEALDRTMWRTRFRTGSGPLVRQTTG
jgi:hypothetical protein